MREQILVVKLNEHVEKAVKYYKEYESTPSEQLLDALSFNCFQAVNYFIDLAQMVALKEKKPLLVTTYKDIFDMLAKRKLLSENELQLAYFLVEMRNIVAHRYHELPVQQVKRMGSCIHKIRPIAAKLAALLPK